MCIVIDTNVLSCVFSGTNCRHDDYRPVLDWILKGPGFAVYGGSSYFRELLGARTYLKLLVELKNRGRAKLVNKVAVDAEQALVEGIVPRACDDAHLIAIFRASGCRLLCSNDRRADTYVKNKRFYRKGQHPPRIYRSKTHVRLLCARNVVALRNIA